MGKDADRVQTQCGTCQLTAGREKSYAVFISGILPQKHGERYKLKRLATCYFLHNSVLFKKGYDGDPLRCLGPEEAREMKKEVHSGECGKHQGRKSFIDACYKWATIGLP